MRFHRLRLPRPLLIKISDFRVMSWHPPFGAPVRPCTPASSRLRQQANERPLRGESGWHMFTMLYWVPGSTGRSGGFVVQGESLSSTTFVSDGDEQKICLVGAALGISLTELTRQHKFKHYH